MFRTRGFIFGMTVVRTGMVSFLFTCSGLRSLVGAYTTLCKPKLYHTCTYNRLPEDEPSGSKHVEEILKN